MEDVGRADYLITKGNPQWIGIYSLPYTDEVMTALLEGALPFDRWQDWIPLPDGTDATIWKRSG